MKRIAVRQTERDIQAIVEDYLTLESIKFFRLPDSLFRALYAGASIPLHIKAELSRFLKGWPDLFIFRPNAEGVNDCLLLELKRKGGRLTQGQKKIARDLNVDVAYSAQEAINTIKEFING